MKSPLDRADGALLAAYVLAAMLGTWNSCLLLNDGAVFLSAVWFGNPWDLYFGQFAGRAVALLAEFGPAWAVRAALHPAAPAFMATAHLLYFAAPLVLWLVLRAIEPQRLFSRLYLAIALALVYFPSELVVGSGLWLLWAALVNNPARSDRQAAGATLLLGIAMAFVHPVLALMSLLYAVIGMALRLLGRPIALRGVIAAGVLGVGLLLAFVVTDHWLRPTNPTVIAALARNRFNYIDPAWAIATMLLYPMLAALWLLLLGPGTRAAFRRWRLPVAALVVIALVGIWFAAAGAGLLTWLYARHTAGYVLALAMVLALAQPAVWEVEARLPLTLYAVVAAVAVVSYNADLFLFGRFVDRHLVAGVTDVDARTDLHWPPQYGGPAGARIYFKWSAGPDYVRDVMVPGLDWYRVTLAFYSYFRSQRQAVLFHPLGRRGDWLPFECAPVERALAQPHDEPDRLFLQFLLKNYCVP